jgi:hypothetical protein
MIFEILDIFMLLLNTFIFLQKSPSKFLFNLILVYVAFKYSFEIFNRLIYNNTVLQAYITNNTIHHLASVHVCLYYIKMEIFPKPILIILWLHFFKDCIIYKYFPSIYPYFCIVYNLSWFISIYYLYKYRDNKYSYPLFINCSTIFIVNCLNYIIQPVNRN